MSSSSLPLLAVQFGRAFPFAARPYSIEIELICPTDANHSLSCVAHDEDKPKNPLRINFDLRWDFKVIWVVQSPWKKYFAGFVAQISSPVRAISPLGGADRDRHERGMRCGGRGSVGRAVCSQGGLP
jgi:hypothetical protein